MVLKKIILSIFVFLAIISTYASSPSIDQISAELESSRKNSGQAVVTTGETISGLSEDVSRLLLSAVDEKLSVDVDKLMYDENKEYWSKHYTSAKRQINPSSFAKFVFDSFVKEKNIKTITEFGCGDGRDSYFFASSGLEVTATDYAESAIAHNNKNNDLDNLQYCVMDVSDTMAMNTLKPTDAYYARFFLHALPQSVRDNFIHWLGSIPENAKIFLEFRTEKDPLKEKSDSFGHDVKRTTHFRRFESLESVRECLISRNLEVLFENESAGLSAVGEDDPVLARLVMVKKIPLLQ